ncbi:DUF1801 domain-containing protein [uncultured Eudoraea sp.]|jgi:hypothetical protein|uniref:DUF1801 domain-containing protein n=1 Tax=uncultured Eudoraea sp. TaxID=1035614 RepID=UPI0026226458|nr:DUF1801 domain-containing protein [uncultured Eudoraea sp.]
MQSNAKTPEEYISELPEDRKQAIMKLRDALLKNLPKGFEEVMSYGMIGYVVPHSIYPSGYHTNPELPLPFINIASQKNFIALYHMGIYSDKSLLTWFVSEYPKHVKTKLDMGKSCIRFKNIEHIPYSLIGELAAKMTAEQWIKIYEQAKKK